MEIWNSLDLNEMLTHVFLRFKVVLYNILRGKEGNDKIEEHRGVKHCKIKIKNVIYGLEKEGNLMGDDLPVHYNEINAIGNEEKLIFENDNV